MEIVTKKRISRRCTFAVAHYRVCFANIAGAAFEPREGYASLTSFAFDKNRRFAKLAPPIIYLPEFIDIGLDVGERNNIVFIFDAGVIFKDEVVVDNSS